MFGLLFAIARSSLAPKSQGQFPTNSTQNPSLFWPLSFFPICISVPEAQVNKTPITFLAQNGNLIDVTSNLVYFLSVNISNTQLKFVDTLWQKLDNKLLTKAMWWYCHILIWVAALLRDLPFGIWRAPSCGHAFPCEVKNEWTYTYKKLHA